jgi:hypothetical protein
MGESTDTRSQERYQETKYTMNGKKGFSLYKEVELKTIYLYKIF